MFFTTPPTLDSRPHRPQRRSEQVVPPALPLQRPKGPRNLGCFGDIRGLVDWSWHLSGTVVGVDIRLRRVNSMMSWAAPLVSCTLKK